ncbi:MAG: hypothetical protein ABSA54_03840 [Terriglobales bacterium]|jgi:hypothetical protein
MKTKPEPKSEKLITLKKMPAKDSPLAPQALGILQALKALGGAAEPAALREKMKTTVKTKQTMGRILLYYRDSLVKDGFIAITKKGGKK